ncbi:unnamed protein product [Boreogadus saida]
MDDLKKIWIQQNSASGRRSSNTMGRQQQQLEEIGRAVTAISTHEPPASFDALVDLAICVDSRLQQRRKWRSPRSLGGAPGEGAGCSSSSLASPAIHLIHTSRANAD